jgi:hypothetical protein
MIGWVGFEGFGPLRRGLRVSARWRAACRRMMAAMTDTTASPASAIATCGGASAARRHRAAAVVTLLFFVGAVFAPWIALSIRSTSSRST